MRERWEGGIDRVGGRGGRSGLKILVRIWMSLSVRPGVRSVVMSNRLYVSRVVTEYRQNWNANIII